jgi:hypothetical protein
LEPLKVANWAVPSVDEWADSKDGAKAGTMGGLMDAATVETTAAWSAVGSAYLLVAAKAVLLGS